MSFQAIAEAYMIPAQLFLIMLGMGANVGAKDFLLVFRYPKDLLVGALVQFVLLPLLAVAFARILGLSPGWSMGLLLLAVVPGGAMSNLLAYFAKAHVALSVGLTTLATISCIFTIPLALGIFAGDLLPAEFELPINDIVVEILYYIILPLAAGMAIHKFSRKRELIAKLSIYVSLILVVIIAASSVFSSRIQVLEYGIWPPTVVLLFGLVLTLFVPIFLRLTGMKDNDTAAISMEIVARNTGIVLLLFRFFFAGQPEQGEVLYVGLFYAGLIPIITMPVLFLNRFGKSPALFFKPYR